MLSAISNGRSCTRITSRRTSSGPWMDTRVLNNIVNIFSIDDGSELGAVQITSSVINTVLSYIECDKQTKDYLMVYAVMGINQDMLIDGHSEKELKIIETNSGDIFINGVTEKICFSHQDFIDFYTSSNLFPIEMYRA
jgi:hypothetical protein